MSSKAEQRALEVYPEQDLYSSLLDGSNRLKREVFMEGYEQAKKDLGWHLSTEHPPVDEEVIVLTDALGVAPYYEIAVGHIIKDANIWNLRGVKYWMPTPKLPKEE